MVSSSQVGDAINVRCAVDDDVDDENSAAAKTAATVHDRSVTCMAPPTVRYSSCDATPRGPRALRLRKRLASANRPSTHLIISW